MCGITGFSGGFGQELLVGMTASIAHRGPDDSGTYFEKESGIGLGHQRLSIIDISSLGHQPMWDSDGRISIVFNGEIFNFKDLRKELLADGVTFKSASDTEVLIYLYLKYGKDMLIMLNGMFAFAIWDTRNKELIIVRDGVGVKPLYYADTVDGFLFSSELKSLLKCSSVKKDLDPEAIKCYLTFLWSPAPKTILKSVKKLEPGHALIIKNGKIEKKWKYYDLPYDQQIVQISEKDAIEGVRNRVENAVESQLVSDVPVGCFLSGGLDSSAITAIAKQKYTHGNLQCFTIGVTGKGMKDEGMTEDLPYARKVAAHLDLDLEVIDIGPEMIDHLERMIFHLDEPQADPAPLNALFICERAREMGVKVLLSGAGGDDIFTGYRRHFALQQEKYWSWLPYIARKGISSGVSRIPSSNPTARRLNKALRYMHLNGDQRIVSYFDWIGRDQLTRLQGPLLTQASDFDAYSPMLETLANAPGSNKMLPLNKMLLLEGKHFLVDHNLNYTDKVSMAAGIEVRVPLLDPELIKYAATLPVNYKQNGNIGKWVFKKSMENYLPKDIIYRPKTGFGAPLRYWLKNELRPLKEELLSANVLKNRGIFNPSEVTKLMELDQSGMVDASYSIFSMMCIELWIRMFVDTDQSL